MPPAAHKPVGCTRDVRWGWFRDRLEFRCPVCGRVGRFPTNFDESLFGTRTVVMCNGNEFIKERIPTRPTSRGSTRLRRYVEIRTDEGRKMFMEQYGVGYGFVTGLRVKHNGEYFNLKEGGPWWISVPEHCIVREVRMQSYVYRGERLG